MQGKLCGFTHGPHEEQKRNKGDCGITRLEQMPGLGEDLIVREGPEMNRYQEHSQDKAEISYPVHNKGLASRRRSALLLEPEADKEVGAQPHTLPANEHKKVTVAQHQQEHGEYEEVQVKEVPPYPFIVVHVTDAVYMNQESYTGHHQDHHRRKRIQEETDE